MKNGITYLAFNPKGRNLLITLLSNVYVANFGKVNELFWILEKIYLFKR